MKWLRPEEISAKKRDIIGFFKLNLEGNEDEIDEQQSQLELTDFKRISYGMVLENRWFLNAVSLVASEDRQLNLLTC